MPEQAWTPVDEPSGWTPVADAGHGGIGGMLKEYWNKINPVAASQGISEAVQHPAAAAKGYAAQNEGMAKQAEDAFKNGNYAEGARHALHYFLNGIPGLGASLDEAGNKAQSGDYEGAIADTAALATNLYAPSALSKVPNLARLPGTSLPEKLYQSALKPSQVNPGRASAAVKTGLENAIPISESGQAKLTGLIQDLSGKVKGVIASDPAATVSRDAVSTRLNDVRTRFGNQAIPQNDLATIDQAEKDFGAAHPSDIPAAKAQELKQGTYAQVKAKSYGEMKTAQIESEKALARGLKEELEAQFPELKSLNAQQGQFYGLEPYLERAVARIGNHNVISLGDMAAAGAGGAMAGGPGAAAATLMRQTLGSPQVKSRLAIALNAAQHASGKPEVFAATSARLNQFLQSLNAATSPSLTPATATQP